MSIYYRHMALMSIYWRHIPLVCIYCRQMTLLYMYCRHITLVAIYWRHITFVSIYLRQMSLVYITVFLIFFSRALTAVLQFPVERYKLQCMPKCNKARFYGMLGVKFFP
jgi:hypothetical protein